jgi:hypothetical protein
VACERKFAIDDAAYTLDARTERVILLASEKTVKLRFVPCRLPGGMHAKPSQVLGSSLAAI